MLATLGTLILVFSPLQLDMLRGLRDYAKTPFLLVAFFLAGLLVTRRLRPRSSVLVGALAGPCPRRRFRVPGRRAGRPAHPRRRRRSLLARRLAYAIKTRIGTLGAVAAVLC